MWQRTEKSQYVATSMESGLGFEGWVVRVVQDGGGKGT